MSLAQALKQLPDTAAGAERRRKSGKAWRRSTLRYGAVQQSPWYGLDFEVDAGRYLAGDTGGTLTITRRFSTGMEIGLFATITNVPFSQFGEGAFDKGFIIRIPMDFLVPLDSQSDLNVDMRPVTRDGGQMLQPEMELYDQLRRTDYGELVHNADALVNP